MFHSSPLPMRDLTIHPLRGLASSLALISFSNRCETSQSTPPSGSSVLASTLPRVHPLQGLASILSHCPVLGSDTICNSPSPALADIVLIGLSLSGFPLKIFKTRLLRRDFHTLIKNVSFSSPTDVGSHKFSPYFVL